MMKKLSVIFLAMLLGGTTAQAQSIYLLKNYGTGHLDEVTSKNKPNGFFYRLRRDTQRTDLPRTEGTENLELFISEPTDMGWMALYRLPLAADDYDFIVVLYDHNDQPTVTLDLCQLTGNNYCEVQDVRWDSDNHYLLFNMACPSYSSMIDGKGSKLYCYDVEGQRMVWETDYLVSNDIFILSKKYVFCSYGFTNERKYLFMLDKFTGKVYSKLPMVKSVQYMELQQRDGRDVLFVVDYDDKLYSFAVSNRSASKKKPSTSTKKPVKKR